MLVTVYQSALRNIPEDMNLQNATVGNSNPETNFVYLMYGLEMLNEKYFVHSDVLSSEGQSVHSPRFSSNGEYLVWLQRPSGGPHHAVQKLMCYKRNLQQVCIFLLYT
jgi:hypothetical protein